MKNALIVGGFVAVFALGICWQVSIWKECRQTNSWGYCMKVLSR